MSLIEIKHLSKQFIVDEKVTTRALDNINICFPNNGLFSILGKSGCGKTTLLNILALIEKPSRGEVFFNGKNVKNFPKKKIDYIRQNEIGIIFQNYQLLEDQDVIYNIALPYLIRGGKYEEGKSKAIELLKSIKFDENLYEQKVSNLSGGEKQRIAILRALINNPRFLLCDEPTGALDSGNTLLVMQILKKVSQSILVIMVSHNEKIVNDFSDEIICLADGKVINHKKITSVKDKPIDKDNIKIRHKSGWIEKLAISNFKRRLGRNIISLVSVTVCLIATILIFGFVQNIDDKIENECQKHLDNGVCTISKQIASNISDTLITLVRQSRPDKNELPLLKEKYDGYYLEYNYDALIPTSPKISHSNKELEGFLYVDVYSFVDKTVNHNLLIKGAFPQTDNLVEVVINKKAYKQLLDEGVEPLNSWIDISYQYELSKYTYDKDNTILHDIFIYEKRVKVVGVVDELEFLSSPTIYYPYTALESFLGDYYVNGQSDYYQKMISWKEIIEQEQGSNQLTSYSYKMFLKDYHDQQRINDDIKGSENNIVIENKQRVKQEALTSLISASCMGVEIFLAIAVIGCILIIGLISFASYSEDKKRSAILSCLGASNTQIIDVYLNENIIVVSLSLILTIILIFPLKNLANYILFNVVGIEDLLSLPSTFFPNNAFPYSFYIFIVLIAFLVCLISSALPIYLFKKISISKELVEE